jgi:hypothetical protein
MSEMFDRAVRSGCKAGLSYVPHSIGPSGQNPAAQRIQVGIKAAVASLAEPDDATVEKMAISDCCGEHCDANNACVGHDMSGDRYAEVYGCLSKERQDRMRANWAAGMAAILPK